MQENPEDICVVEDWMLDLVEDDRLAQMDCESRVTAGLHWMYRSSLLRYN